MNEYYRILKTLEEAPVGTFLVTHHLLKVKTAEHQWIDKRGFYASSEWMSGLLSDDWVKAVWSLS